jgi:hypothetical protein
MKKRMPTAAAKRPRLTVELRATSTLLRDTVDFAR